MVKYHISKNGTPSVCKAKNICPLGSEQEHFSTMKEAQEYADKKNQQTLTKVFSEEMNDVNSLAYKVNKFSDVKNPGFDNETFLSASYAKELGLNNALIVNIKDDGKISTRAIGEDKLTTTEKKNIIKLTTNTLSDYYIDKHNVMITDRSKLVKVVYYSKGNDKIVVQTGAPNVLDAAVVELNNKKVNLMEIKKGADSSKSQYGQKSLQVDNNGNFTENSLEDLPLRLKEKLRKENISNYIGKDKVLEIEEQDSLEYFVSEYKKAGASKIAFTNGYGHPVYLDVNSKKTIEELKENGAKAYITIRTNKNSKLIDSNGIERLNKNKNLFIKDISNKDSFKISEINPKEVTISAGFIKFGEFRIEKINGKSVKNMFTEDNLKDNIVVKKSELRTMTPQITGNIRFNKTIK